MGMMSSLHCVGMCGPIALALSAGPGSRRQQLARISIYNLGRASSYAILGLVAGTLGASLAWAGTLRFLSAGAGMCMLAYVLWPAWLSHGLRLPVWWTRCISGVKKQMGAYLQKPGPAARFLLGLLNGLVPCGMVYMALLSALSTGNAFSGGIFMFLFGLGTIPAMLAAGLVRERLSPVLRRHAGKLTPILLLVAGSLLILRSVATVLPDAVAQHPALMTICR
ncbi:sulfite exporter TauE/SafE family protein [Dyadobacter sandarakinus]|uniref:Sulfite exporter TauE/SafE family protein n=2 Tax=Dyadobacter sandarakinus TaxID=2747268 RepID=A0ABX7IEG3_9BACT|nr:sulfite exporter TauE/SafE family protein [Dyadobacter sandarakinus]